jgi:hypothetical protein
MVHELDRLLEQLRDQPLDRDLVRVESHVEARIGRPLHEGRGAASGPARVAIVSLALALGAGIGGISAAAAMTAPKSALLASTEALAPSTLLGGSR